MNPLTKQPYLNRAGHSPDINIQTLGHKCAQQIMNCSLFSKVKEKLTYVTKFHQSQPLNINT